jgi:DNA-binding MarR family transcriptional regulator
MTTPKRAAKPAGPKPAGLGGLDRVLHERSRLAILIALLSRPEGVVFPELRRLCGFTDGNLNRHLAVLQEAGVVESWKSADPGRPRTLVKFTTQGRTQFLAYLAELERVVRDAKAAQAPDTAPRFGGGALGGPGFAPA